MATATNRTRPENLEQEKVIIINIKRRTIEERPQSLQNQSAYEVAYYESVVWE